MSCCESWEVESEVQGGLKETPSCVIKQPLGNRHCSLEFVGGAAYTGQASERDWKRKTDSCLPAFPLTPLGTAIRISKACVWYWGDHRNGSADNDKLSYCHLLGSIHRNGLGFQGIAWERWFRAMPRRWMGPNVMISIDGQFYWMTDS